MTAKLAYAFRDAALRERALSHRSVGARNNERLEFLGDGLVNLLVAELLYERFTNADEGELTRWRARLVSEPALAGIARELELGEQLRLGPGELKSGGFRRDSILADAFEAMIAAIYLDGGLEAIRTFVQDYVLDAPMSSDEDAGTDIQPAITNFKSALQELAQSRRLPQPRYAIVRERGPEHSKVFTVEVRVGKEWNGQADGRTKKIAAQRAARGVYERLMQEATAGSLAVE